MSETVSTAIALPGRITTAVGVTILIQTALALLWAGAAAERITHLERSLDQSAILLERTARLEEQVIAMRQSLVRIENKLDEQD